MHRDNARRGSGNERGKVRRRVADGVGGIVRRGGGSGEMVWKTSLKIFQDV